VVATPPVYPFIFNGLTLLIVVVSVALLLRQKGSYFRSVQWLFVGAYVSFSISIILEFLRDLVEQKYIGFYYTTVGVSAILTANWMLTLSAVMISYGEASGSNIRRIFGSVSMRRVMPFILYTMYVAILLILVWVMSPFDLVLIERVYGDKAIAPVFYEWYGLGMWIIEFAFIAYPCLLMVRRGIRSRSPIASRALPTLAVAWAGVGMVLLLFNGVLRYMDVEIVDIGNLISASLFITTAYYFRRTSLLESLFEAPIVQPKMVYLDKFSKDLGIDHIQLLSKKILLEFDASTNYERSVQNFAYEALGHSELVAVFTHRGSPVYNAVTPQPGIRFFCLTPQTSYPKQGSFEAEMLLPPNDTSILLSALDKVLKAFSGRVVTVIFDNISDMILSIGAEKTYTFLTYAIEVLSRPKVTALFLINPQAHDSKIVSAVRSLFSIHITHGKEGVKVTKAI